MYYMQYLLQDLVKWHPFESREGVTAVEYALIAGITVLAILAGVTAVGISLSSFFARVAAGF
jgi:Flp pilus assembly pilin Flp